MTRFDLVVIAVGAVVTTVGWRVGARRVILPLAFGVAGLAIAIAVLPRIALETDPSQVALRSLLLHVGFVGLPMFGFSIGSFIARSSGASFVVSTAERVVGSLAAIAALGLVLWVLSPLSSANAVVSSWSAGSTTAELLAAAPEPPVDIEGLVARDTFPIGLSRLLGPVEVGPPPSMMPPIEPAALANAEQASVQISHTSCGGFTLGSGFSIGDGLVLTNAHVVAGSQDDVEVATETGTARGTVVGFDRGRDLAVVSVPGLAVPSLTFDDEPAERDDIVITLGHPGGQATLDVSPARVVERNFMPILVEGNAPAEPLTYVLATDDVRPGSSGGAVINQDGAVVAVVFAGPKDDREYALAVSILEAPALLESLTSQPVATGGCE